MGSSGRQKQADNSTGDAGALSRSSKRELLERTSRQLDAIINNTKMAIFMMDDRQHCVFMNRAAEELTGYRFAETQGRPLHDVIHHTRPDGSHYPLEDCPIDRAFPERNQVEGTEVFVHKDGHFYTVGFTASPIRDDDGATIGTVIEAKAVDDDLARDRRLKRRSNQLRALADSALRLAEAATVDETLDQVTKSARRIIGAHQAVVSLTRDDDWGQAINAVDLTDKYSAWADYNVAPDGSGIYALVCEENRPVRMTQKELEAHPRWRGFGSHAADHPPMRGWLAAPLIGRDGRNLGLIQLSDKFDGTEFDESDEAILVQLAQLASAALEQTSVEGALRSSESRFRAVFENAGVGMAEIDRDWLIVGANPAYSRITGYSADELIGMGSLALTHPDDIEQTKRAIAAVRADDTQSTSFEKRYVRKDGKVVWVRSNLTRLEEDGSRFLKIVEDITEAKAAQEALRERSEEFYTLADNIPVLAWMAYADGHIFWYNRRWYDYTGTSPETQEGWGWDSVHDPAILPQVVERWKHSLDTGEPFEMIFPLRGADGLFRPFLTRVVPIHGDDGSIVRWFGTNVDVSDRMDAEAKLREEGHNLEVLNRVGSVLAGELDLERVVQMVTDAGVDLTGAEFGAFFYNVENEAGEAYMLYTLSGAEREQFEKFGMPRKTKVFAPTFDGDGIVRSYDITTDPRYGQNPPHKGMPEGHLPVRSYLAIPVVGRSGDVIGGLFFGHSEPGRFRQQHESLMSGVAAQAAIAIDNARLFREAQREIDQRVRAEQALTALNETLESRVLDEIERRSRAEEALRQAQKMETVGQLSGGIAHDFNNLLQVIHGNLTLLRQALPEDEAKWQRAVGNAILGAERAASLTRRLLAFSRRQSLEPRPVDVSKLVSEMSDLLQRTLGETVRVEMDLQADLPAAQVDPNQLENAILNLAINARDAMPDGGVLTIVTKAAEIGPAYLDSHPEASPGKYLRLSVIDDGEGMDPETLSHAVEPFFTTKEVGRGTGLGLSMVYGFVRQSGGHFEIQSELGKGTLVDIYLPWAEWEVSEPSAEAARGELRRGDGETILLCEDDPDVRQFSAETLSDLGYRVIEAGDAAEALALLEKAGEVDLLFTDVVLPGGKTGAELAREARSMRPGLKVLFTTGYARSALDDTVMEAGVDLLPKPFSVDDLAARLAAILD